MATRLREEVGGQPEEAAEPPDVVLARAAAAAMEEAAPKVPTVEAHLQYGTAPRHIQSDMKMMVTLTPPEGMKKPDVAHVVLCLDESYSMEGASMTLLKEFCTNLFKKGVPGVELHLRILMFGREVVDKKVGELELAPLNDATRDEFLKIADEMEARQGATNISDPVKKAVEVLKVHRDSCEDPPPCSYVVVLTDGCANSGKCTTGDSMQKLVVESVGMSPIFVHYIGLGRGVNPMFMSAATKNGDLGVFSVAPDAGKLPNAFEEVFGYALETRFSFDIEIGDAKGKRIERRGMLLKERSVLVDVTTSDASITSDAVSVQLLSGGQPVGRPVLATICVEGVELKDENPKVRELMDIIAVDAKMAEIQATSEGDLEGASQRMHTYALESQGAYGDAALKRMKAMADQTFEDAAEYRSLGKEASEMYSVRTMTQSQYA